jgi:hypothetical protein
MRLVLLLSALAVGDALIAGGLLRGTTSLRAARAPDRGCSAKALLPAGASRARLLAHPGWRRAPRGRLQLAMSEDAKETAADKDVNQAANGRAGPLGAEDEDDFSALDDSQRKFKAAGECRGR